jgi:hypothetical protein
VRACESYAETYLPQGSRCCDPIICNRVEKVLRSNKFYTLHANFELIFAAAKNTRPFREKAVQKLAYRWNKKVLQISSSTPLFFPSTGVAIIQSLYRGEISELFYVYLLFRACVSFCFYTCGDPFSRGGAPSMHVIPCIWNINETALSLFSTKRTVFMN